MPVEGRKVLQVQQEHRFASVLLSRLGTPLSKRLLRALKEGDWVTLIESRIEPNAYTKAHEYFLDALASGLFRKCRDLNVQGVDKPARARQTFFEGEAACKKTNARLRPYLSCEADSGYDPAINIHVEAIRKILRDLLGRAPKREQVVGEFGPGATLSDPSRRSTIGDKMNSRPHCTSRTLERWFPSWELTLWGRAALNRQRFGLPCVVRAGRFATAPKDATKDRPIMVEPSIASFYQLGLERVMRRRLGKVGIDLDYGQNIHWQVAKEASRTGLDATVDLRNASGTVAKVAVQLLFPADWLELMWDLRVPCVLIDGRHQFLEQFSGMGNGYTFALETCLFYAIARYAADLAGSERRVLVYGDDIIVGVEVIPFLYPMLRFFGFSVNEEKSFTTGPFRESCGGDFYRGMSVRPFFLREGALDEPHKIIAAANGLRRAINQNLVPVKGGKEAWFALLDLLPSHLRRCRGPSALGDICIHDDEKYWNVRWRSGIRYIQVYRPVARGFWPRVTNGWVPLGTFDEDVQFACAIYGSADTREVGQGPTLNRGTAALAPRENVTGYKIGWSAYS